MNGPPAVTSRTVDAASCELAPLGSISIIAPVIIVICAVGAYTVHNHMFDVVMMLVFGVLGYAFKKLNYPLAPLVLALVLGDMAESSFRQSMLISKGSLGVFFESGLSASITLLALLMLVWPLINKLKSSKGNGQLISS